MKNAGRGGGERGRGGGKGGKKKGGDEGGGGGKERGGGGGGGGEEGKKRGGGRGGGGGKKRGGRGGKEFACIIHRKQRSIRHVFSWRRGKNWIKRTPYVCWRFGFGIPHEQLNSYYLLLQLVFYELIKISSRHLVSCLMYRC